MPSTFLRRIFVPFLLITLLFAGAGCEALQNIPVPNNAVEALKEGDTREAAADKLKAEKKTEGAKKLYQDTANYYGAVAKKYVGTPEAAEAIVREAKVYEEDLNNKQQALTICRRSQQQYATSPVLLEYLTGLGQRIDQENSKNWEYKILLAASKLLGNDARYSYVLLIILISVSITLALWPLRLRQYKGMKEMQKHQPRMKEIQDKYKDNPQLLQEKMSEFYKEHGFNPMAGCLPLVFQMPILWWLYHAISLFQFQFAKSTFLWINPSAAAASADWPMFLKGAVARNLGEQDLFLLLVYAVSMYLQTKTTPVTDPQQAEQQRVMSIMMPSMFFVMMLQWHLPAAFVLYWFCSNLLSTGQQYLINRSFKTGSEGAGGAVAISDSNPTGTPTAGGTAATATAGAGDKTLTANRKLISPRNRRKK